MAASASETAPDTIVLIHGFWVTPRSWEHWKQHYEDKGFTVLTPGYPGFEAEVEALRADPTPIEQLEVSEIIGTFETLIGSLDRPPIIMGHSAGGAFTQILLDHGFGAAGVAINSAPTEGVKVIPLSQIKSSFPVLKNPANRHRAVGLTPEQWYDVFANTFSKEESSGTVRAVPHPCLRQDLLGKRAREHPPGQGRHLRQLRQRRPAAPPVHLREERSALPAQGRPLERQALQGEHGDRDRGIRRTTLPARGPGVAVHRRFRPRLGTEARNVALEVEPCSGPRVANEQAAHLSRIVWETGQTGRVDLTRTRGHRRGRDLDDDLQPRAEHPRPTRRTVGGR